MMKLKAFFNHPYFIAGLYGFAILHGMSCTVITNRNFEIKFNGDEDSARTLLAGLLEASGKTTLNGKELTDAEEEKA